MLSKVLLIRVRLSFFVLLCVLIEQFCLNDRAGCGVRGLSCVNPLDSVCLAVNVVVVRGVLHE